MTSLANGISMVWASVKYKRLISAVTISSSGVGCGGDEMADAAHEVAPRQDELEAELLDDPIARQVLLCDA